MSDIKNEDIGFVHSLYAQAYDKPKRKVDLLFVSVLVITVGLIVWANFANIDEITKGEGKVIPSSKIQKIQNLDGGIVSEILVRNGEHVKKDQPLMRIDTTRFEATLEGTKDEFESLLARKARLEAQLSFNPGQRIPAMRFSKGLNEYSEYAQLEMRNYNNNIEEHKSSLKILELQFGQKVQEKVEIESKIKQLKRQVILVKEQLETIERLVNSGSKSKVDLLNIQKDYNQLQGDLDAAVLSLPRSKLSIEESENKILEKVKGFKAKSSQELQEVMAKINQTDARMVSDTDKLDKTVIRSPVDGIIKQININTIGSVVKSGVDLIEIISDSDVLLVEAKIDPKDIAFISPAQKAVVKLTAYDYAIYGGLDGSIVEISADSIVDPESKDGKSYYQIIVRTDKNYMVRNGQNLPIIPGMVASVDIVTGKKTIMDFFLKPILKVKEGSLHER
jgi:membrane fusion protein, adhesin transport system